MFININKSSAVNGNPIEETKLVLKNYKNIAICTVLETYNEALELEKILNEMGLEYDICESDKKFKITTFKGNIDEEFKINNHYLLYIDKKYIGCNNDLGKSLIIDYFNSLLNSTLIPKHFIFINEGVELLSCVNISTILKELHQIGICILACEQSLKYFNIEKQNFFSDISMNKIIDFQLKTNVIIKI